MNKKWMAVAACMLVVGMTACADADNDDDVTTDTSLVSGQDTVDMPMAVPTTDTVVHTTTTETDTIEGDVADSLDN